MKAENAFLSAGGLESLLGRHLLKDGGLTGTQNMRAETVRTRTDYFPESLSAEFRLNDDTSYVTIFFNEAGRFREGIRIGRDPTTGSSYFVLEGDGSFVSRIPLPLKPSKYFFHHVEMTQTKSGKILVAVSGSKPIEVPTKFSSGKLGLQATHLSEIGNFVVTENGSHRTLELVNSPFNLRVLGIQTGTFLLFAFLLLAFFREIEVPAKVFWFAFYSGLIWVSFDHFHLRRYTVVYNARSLRSQSMDQSALVDFEALRRTVFDPWSRFLGLPGFGPQKLKEMNLLPEFSLSFARCSDGTCVDYAVEKIYYLPYKKPNLRVAIVGGSMAVGEGVRNRNQSLHVQLYQKLAPLSPRPLELFNLSKSNFDPETYRLMERFFDDFKPEIVYLFLPADHILSGPFREILSGLKRRKIQVYFVRLPVCPEINGTAYVDTVREILSLPPGVYRPVNLYDTLFEDEFSRVKASGELNVIDVNPAWLEPARRTSGILFTDARHLNDFGVGRYTDLLVEPMSKTLNPAR